MGRKRTAPASLVPGRFCLSWPMHIDVDLRARAARTLLDAVSAVTVDDSGTDKGDEVMLLALQQLDLDLASDPRVAAAMAASTDLIWYLTNVVSQWREEAREATISTIRQNVLPMVYPDATGA